MDQTTMDPTATEPTTMDPTTADPTTKDQMTTDVELDSISMIMDLDQLDPTTMAISWIPASASKSIAYSIRGLLSSGICDFG